MWLASLLFYMWYISGFAWLVHVKKWLIPRGGNCNSNRWRLYSHYWRHKQLKNTVHVFDFDRYSKFVNPILASCFSELKSNLWRLFINFMSQLSCFFFPSRSRDSSVEMEPCLVNYKVWNKLPFREE